jgi:phosphatidylglycerophosphate synthase
VTRSPAEPAPPARPGVGEFYATHRGGGLYSAAVSQRLGALLAYAANRIGLAPRTLTLANLAVGLTTSTIVAALAAAAAAGRVAGWAVGLVALLGWQAAYALDCADGQLARTTGRSSPVGARLDILCDLAAQTGLVTALSVVATAYRPTTPTWLVAAFAGTWLVNLVTSVLQDGTGPASLVRSRAPAVRVVKLLRDYGAVVGLAGLVLTLAPMWSVALLWLCTAVNGAFLLASIAAAGYRAEPAPESPAAGSATARSPVADAPVAGAAPAGSPVAESPARPERAELTDR